MERSTSPEWHVRVVGSSRDAATAYVRGHRFDVGPPLSFDSEEGRVTALELALGAIGAELAVGIRRAARLRRVAVESVEASVSATLWSPLAYLRVVGEEGGPRIRSVRVRLYITTEASREDVEPVWEDALAVSPLAATLRAAVELDLSWKVVP